MTDKTMMVYASLRALMTMLEGTSDWEGRTASILYNSFKRIVTRAEMPQFSYAMGKMVPGVFDDWRKLDRQVDRAVVSGPDVAIGRRVPAIVA